MSSSTRLSVNLNKVALLRNSRHTGVPDLLRFAGIAREAGAGGLTVHPRPDERHIRASDVPMLAEWMAPYRPGLELNIEGFPDVRLLKIVEAVRPEQCTLVPDDPGAFTSEEGWKLDGRERGVLESMLPRFRATGARIILFVDPDPSAVERVPATGAAGIEIYTGSYAAEARDGSGRSVRDAVVATAQAAIALGLSVNIGHDLNLDNLPPLMAAMPEVAEASIGHELTADALELGFAGAVAAYKAALTGT